MTDDKKKRNTKAKKPNPGGRPVGILTDDSRTDRVAKLAVGKCESWTELIEDPDVFDRKAKARARVQALKSLMHKTCSRASAITLGSYQIGGDVLSFGNFDDPLLYSVVIVTRTK
jgi:hypothetical protein